MSDEPLYVPCPRCQGDRQVYAYTKPPTDFFRGEGEYFTCPLCAGTAEADRESAAEWMKDHEDE